MPKVLWLILGVSFAISASTVGDLLIASGMRKVGVLKWKNLRSLPKQILSVVKTPQIPMSIVFMATFFFTWLALLSRADLSLILPMTAGTYILNALAAGPVLGEQVSSRRWLGILIITVGVVFVTVSGN